MLEMLHAILIKFPRSVVDSQAKLFFLDLVVALANEHDQKVRSMVSTVLRELIARTSPDTLNSILDFSLSWYMGEKEHLWGASAQVRYFIFLCYSVMPVALFILCASMQFFLSFTEFGCTLFVANIISLEEVLNFFMKLLCVSE